MYARFIENAIYPKIILAPDGYQPGSGGHVTVTLASQPLISINAQLSGAMEIAEAEQWSEVLKMAISIAKGMPVPWMPENVLQEWWKVLEAAKQ